MRYGVPTIREHNRTESELGSSLGRERKNKLENRQQCQQADEPARCYELEQNSAN